jgi:hypothetical protein
MRTVGGGKNLADDIGAKGGVAIDNGRAGRLEIAVAELRRRTSAGLHIDLSGR